MAIHHHLRRAQAARPVLIHVRGSDDDASCHFHGNCRDLDFCTQLCGSENVRFGIQARLHVPGGQRVHIAPNLFLNQFDP